MPTEPNHGPVCVGLDNGCPDCKRLQAASLGAGSTPFKLAGTELQNLPDGQALVAFESVIDAIEQGLTDADAELSRAAWRAINRRLRHVFSPDAERQLRALFSPDGSGT